MIRKTKKKILMIDDMRLYLSSVKDVLRDEYEIYQATSAEEAFKILDLVVPDLILLDIFMPGIDGYDVIKTLKANKRLKQIPVIFLTSDTASESEVKGLDMGAADFITKPFVLGVMKKRIATHIALAEYERSLKDMVNEKVKEIERMQDLISVGFAELVESRDGITGGHVKNTSIYFKTFIGALKDVPRYSNEMTEEFVTATVRSAPLHDIGKIAITDEVLRKASKLDSREFEYMKSHAVIGGATFHKIRNEIHDNYFIKTAEEMAMYHHEKWDGTGYPIGLKGEDIPLSARIMSIVDVYDALTSQRPYKEPFSHEKAMTIIAEGKGKLFDPELADEFIKISPLIKDCMECKPTIRNR